MTSSPFHLLARCTQEEGNVFALYDWAREQVRFASAPRHGPVDIPAQEAEDLVISSLIRLHDLVTTGDRAGNLLVEKLLAHPDLRRQAIDLNMALDPEAPALHQADRLLQRYFRHMLGTAWLDQVRKQERARQLAEQAAEALHPSSEPPPDRSLSEARDAVERALHHVLEHRQADPALLEESVRQLWQLSDGTTTLRALADEEVAADPALRDHPDGWKVARDRLYRRHRLARRYLMEAADALAHDPEGGPELALLVHQTLHALTRRHARPSKPCPKRSGRDVPGAEESE